MSGIKSQPGIYVAAAFLATGMWGFFSIPLRSLMGFSSEVILCYRILVSMLLLVSFQVLFNRKTVVSDWQRFRALDKTESRRWIRMSLFCSILITLNWYSYIFVINHINIQSGAFAYMVCPLLTALFAFIFLKEHLGKLQKWALILALLALMLLATRYFIDVLWSFFIAIWYAVYLVVQKISPPIEKGLFLTVQLLISFIFTIPYYILGKPGIPADPHFWWIILLISLVFTVIPLYLSLFSLQAISSTTMGIILYFNPLVSFAVAIFYFHESLNYFKLSSYILVLIAVILFNWMNFSRRGKIQTA